MRTETLDGASYLRAVQCGASRLKTNKEVINNLNVFPIPDGDTGDNMFMTISAGASNSDGKGPLSDVAASIAQGMLLGARGNSGVILSRIFAGIAKGLSGADCDTTVFACAMECGVKEAYGAVSNPVEGTILTVLKDGVKVAGASASEDFETYFAAMANEMAASLERTPDLLDVLKRSGVVDSGGAGLLCIAKGMAASLDGEEPQSLEADVARGSVNLDAFSSDSILTFGYCTEFLLRLQSSKVDLASFDESQIRDYLDSVGDSVVCFREGSIVKVHVHTKKPGDILNHCQKWGEYLTLKIENMTLQHSEKLAKESDIKVTKHLGVVAVASGEGIISSFRDAGVDEVIEGGQTMNPSASDFIKAFDSIGAEHIIVLPNNSNILLTARQAAQLYTKSDVRVVGSCNIGAGYIAAASIDYSQKDIDAIVADAEQTCASTECLMVSVAIRDTVLDGETIKAGSHIGFSEGKIISSGPSANEAAKALPGIGDHDVAIIFHGSGVSEEEAQSLSSSLGDKFPMTEFILNDGGQPVYDYIIILC